MSKITQALEKAARERQRHVEHKDTEEIVTVTAKPILVPLAPPSTGAAAVDETAQPCSVKIDPHIVSAADPSSPISEQYRILRTNLQSLKGFVGAKTIVLTSAVHEEGKSVTSINLAITLAQQEGLKVLLVDADLRRSTIHHWLGVEGEHGLSTVLANGGSLNGSIVRLQSPPLSVLPAGPTPNRPAELLESTAMKRLLAMLKTQYDVIIIDAPPILPVTDPSILGAQADGVLLVVRAGKTQRKVVQQAHELLKQSKARILGSILTHVDHYVPGYYKYYHYYRYTKDGNGKNGGKRSTTDRTPDVERDRQTTVASAPQAAEAGQADASEG